MQTIKTKIVGVSKDNFDGHSRQRLIEKYVNDECRLYLEREQNNLFDPNAVAVYVDNWENDEDWDNQIGYLSAEVAAQVAPRMDEGYIVNCELLQRTGGDDKNYGVNILLTLADEKVQRIAIKPNAETKQIPEKKPKKEITRSSYVTNTSDKKKTVALLLCIFLGFLGAHYFYVGRIGKGLLYMITAGLFGIGWIVDIIKILLGSFKDNVGNPLRV